MTALEKHDHRKRRQAGVFAARSAIGVVKPFQTRRCTLTIPADVVPVALPEPKARPSKLPKAWTWLVDPLAAYWLRHNRKKPVKK